MHSCIQCRYEYRMHKHIPHIYIYRMQKRRGNFSLQGTHAISVERRFYLPSRQSNLMQQRSFLMRVQKHQKNHRHQRQIFGWLIPMGTMLSIWQLFMTYQKCTILPFYAPCQCFARSMNATIMSRKRRTRDCRRTIFLRFASSSKALTINVLRLIFCANITPIFWRHWRWLLLWVANVCFNTLWAHRRRFIGHGDRLQPRWFRWGISMNATMDTVARSKRIMERQGERATVLPWIKWYDRALSRIGSKRRRNDRYRCVIIIDHSIDRSLYRCKYVCEYLYIFLSISLCFIYLSICKMHAHDIFCRTKQKQKNNGWQWRHEYIACISCLVPQHRRERWPYLSI